MEPYCAAVMYYGSRNPDSPNFGPDEYCEEDAVPGEEYCEHHLYAVWS